MKKIVVLFLAFVTIFVAGFARTARAAEELGFKAGTWELAVYSTHDSNGSPRLSPRIGYFIADNFEIIAHFDSSNYSGDIPNTKNDANITATRISAALMYNAPVSERIVPYIFAEGSYSKYKIDYDGTSSDKTNDLQGFSFGAGLRLLIGDKGAVSFHGQYDMASQDYGADDNAKIDGYNIGIIYSVFIN